MKFPKFQSFFVFTNTHLIFLLFTTFLIILGASLGPYLHSNGVTNTNSIPKRVITPLKRPGDPPILAYWIHGSNGDTERMLRLLKAIYHPRNQYLLLLDASSSAAQRTDLALLIESEPLFAAFDNVNVVGRNYAVNQMGVSGLAALLHAAALLLRISKSWDWFITLSASDYPLMNQDDILHAFTFLPRDLNFVHFKNATGSNESDGANQVVVDPSVYNTKSSPIVYAKETRDAPNTFKILAGSPWVILSRPLIDFCITGWDNFPRKLLMYMNNVPSPLDFYFQTLLCNSPAFQNTTIDNDLRYVAGQSDEPKLEEALSNKTAIVARRFKEAMMNEVDENVLKRLPNGFVPGKWCFDGTRNGSEETVACGPWGDVNAVEAGPEGLRLGRALSRLASEGRVRFEGCNGPGVR